MKKPRILRYTYLTVLSITMFSCGGSDDSSEIPNNDKDNDGIIAANDCDDTDSTVLGATIWYADSDGDDFGDAEVTKSACTQPTGYVEDNTDTDDSNDLIFPGCVAKYFLDYDVDCFGDGTKSSCAQLENYVEDDTDCNDLNPDINPSTMITLGRDLDGDGYPGDDETLNVSTCELDSTPTDYYPLLPNNMDCDDQNPDLGGEIIYASRDHDGDSYLSATVLQFTECELPLPPGYLKIEGYLEYPILLDCDDNNPEVYPGNGCGGI